jgi:Zn-dependent peptidase ImmA (M78 family)
MKPLVIDHPRYPFREEFLRAYVARGLLFVDGPAPGSAEHALLSEFLGLVHAYAFLERIVQGEVVCDVPVHLNRVLAGLLDPQDEGERLASEETGLLDWTPESADSLVDALDEIGVKIICRDDPEDSPAPPGPRLGAFTFEGDAGPAILVGASPHTLEAAFIVAHEFGHLAADIDPYQPRLCRWDATSFANLSGQPQEVRADRFARALLMPHEPFHRALRVLGARPPEGADPRVEQLAALFGVPTPIAARRLLDLGFPAAGQPVEPSGAVPAEPSAEARVTQPSSALTLPERFVNLALAAYAGRALDADGLARFLRSTTSEALQIAEIAGVSPQRLDDWE